MYKRNLFTEVYLVEVFIGRFARVHGFDFVRIHLELLRLLHNPKIILILTRN